MRNLVLSRAIAEATHKHPAFAIAYMGPDLPISDYIESERSAGSSVYCGKRHRHQDRSKFGSSYAALQLLNQV